MNNQASFQDKRGVTINCLHVMADRLTHLLPVCPTGIVCARPLPVTLVDGKYVVTLPEIPEFNTLTLYSTNGTVITLNATDGPTINYVTGQIIFTTNGSTELAEVPGPHVVVDYSISLAEEYIQQAVMDLGDRVPRKQTTHFMTNDTGVTPLPLGLTRILSLCRVSCGCTCQPSSCPDGYTTSLCGQAPCFACHHCATYIDAGNLIQAAGPCKAEQFDICYLARYTLDKYGCYPSLTADLVDLVMLKAQSLAYRNPQMLMAISGLSINRNNSNSSASGSQSGGSSSTNETTTTIKTKDNCGKEEKTVTTKTGGSTSSNLSTSTASALSSLFSSSTGSGLAEQFESLYLAAIHRRTNMATLHITPKRTGYKSRFAAYC